MKKRYYLRGLGMGILFTALFFMVGGKSEPAMSDEMIIERAKELGMIESTVLADISDSTEMVETESAEVVVSEESVDETVSEMVETTTETEETTSDTVEESVEETVSEETDTAQESEKETTSEEETTEEKPEVSTEETSVEDNSEEESSGTGSQTGQTVSVIVNKGEGSDAVSHRLYEMGLVDDPYEFDRYLMQNGYDKRIGAGEHQIPVGASWQEIARILTS